MERALLINQVLGKIAEFVIFVEATIKVVRGTFMVALTVWYFQIIKAEVVSRRKGTGE
jgi:hypothetical protein